MSKYISILFFYLIGLQMYAKTPFYYKINTADGLDNNTIYDITQDKTGYYWIGTDTGLYTYDGTVLNKISIQNPSGIHNIQLDAYGRIWFQNFDGELYYYSNDVLSKIKNVKLKGYFEYQIIGDQLFLPLQNYFAELNLKSLKLKHHQELSTHQLKETFTTKDKFGYINSKMLVLHNTTTEKYIVDQNFGLQSPLITAIDNDIYIFDKYKKSHYYLFTNKKFKRIDEYIDVEFKQNVTHFGNTIWISSSDGILRYNTISRVKTKYYTNKNISQIFKDRYAHYWISTLTEGLLFVENLDSRISNNSIHPLLFTQLNNELIIGTKNDQILRYDKGNVSILYTSKTNHPYLLLKSDNLNNSILATSSKFNWLKDRKVKDALHSVKDITPISPNNYAFAASRYFGVVTDDLDIYHANRKKFPHHFNIETGELYFTIINTEVNGKSVAYNPTNNTIYYATKNGLYSVRNHALVELTTNNKNPIYLKKIVYNNGSIICLSNYGNIQEITSNNIIRDYSIPYFLKHEGIIDFKIIDQSIYFFTQRSVYQYNPQTDAAIKILNVNPNFSVTDVENVGDTLFFATTLGILKYKSSYTINDHIPDFKITSVHVNNNQVDLNKIHKFLTNENNFEINFKLISSNPNEYYRISYQINDDDWNYINPKARTIALPSLAHGDYRIKVKVEGTFDQPLIEEVKFTINHPFWYSPYFISLFFLTVTALIYKFYLREIEKVNLNNSYKVREIELENEINIQKLKSLQSQMNPHFFFNALNTIQSYILSNDKKIAVYYLSKFSKLTRQILNLTSKDFISLKEEIDTNEIYLEIEKSRFNDDFTYQISNINNVDLEQWRIPSLLLQPLIENALKHGLLHKKGHKYLDIIITEINDKIIISIIDNGIGRVASAKINSNRVNHQAFATKAIENRIKIMNESYDLDLKIDYIDLYDEFKRPTGTEVKIIFNKQTYESNNH